MFKQLLSPIKLGPTQLSNRIFNPPHGTTLGHAGVVTDDLIAYHKTRAQGGVGLIILESMTFHPSYGFRESFLYAGSDDIIPGLNKLATSCRRHGTPVFGQLFHAGRAVRLSHDGSKPLAYSASDVPDERYRVIPVPMPNDMVWEIIDGYVNAAGRLAEADLDGIEILASMGYLIAQFLNPQTNRREDEFGGNFDNRLKFLREIVSGVRKRIGLSKTLGIRITLNENTETGLESSEVIKICMALEADDDLDYFSVISGSSSSPGGWIHVFPPMAIPHAFVASDAQKLKQAVNKPVLVAGRINQPQIAENILAEGKADMVGMARALISDPDFVRKVITGQTDDIRACIGCNQACVGHRLAHHAISCIQNPRAGRELLFAELHRLEQAKKVLVIGAGPGGMKAAVIAAQRGHQVQIIDKADKMGGQVNLAEQLPGRAEFGGVTTNLAKEISNEKIELRLKTEVSHQLIEEIKPDSIIIAIGADSRLPEVDVEGTDMVDAWALIRGDANPGKNVVIADWSCDWTGLGTAEKLAREGHYVRLLSAASVAGESIQGIVRDQWIGELHKLNVELIPYARFYGSVDDTAYFQHLTSGEAIVCEDVDTIVSCYAAQSRRECDWIKSGYPDIDVVHIGDALSPRTVEEAILEGLQAAWKI